MFWSHSHNDLTTLVSLKSQEKMAHCHQDYETFRLVVDEALGGSSEKSGSDEGDAVGSFDELARAFAAVGGTIV